MWLKRSVWWVFDRLAIDPVVLPDLNRFRRDLGLPPVSRVFNAWLHSPQRVIALFPGWFAPWQPDWPPQLRLTGFPLYDAGDQHGVSPELDARAATPLDETCGLLEEVARDAFAAK